MGIPVIVRKYKVFLRIKELASLKSNHNGGTKASVGEKPERYV